jgi:soluble lytic murein transglycosylase-like protein
VRIVPVFATLSLCALAQQNPDAIRQAMSASLQRQRESVRIQLSSAVQVRERMKPGRLLITDSLASGDCEPLAQTELDNLIEDAARKEGLDPRLVREVARQESGFRPCAVSGKGALGLMQLMPSTAKDLDVDNPFDPRGSITAGSRFLKLLLDRYDGDLASALGAYNAGPARVDKAGGVPSITETQQYVSTILNRLSSDR